MLKEMSPRTGGDGMLSMIVGTVRDSWCSASVNRVMARWGRRRTQVMKALTQSDCGSRIRDWKDVMSGWLVKM